MHFGETNCVESTEDGVATFSDSTVTTIPEDEIIDTPSDEPQVPLEEDSGAVEQDPDWDPAAVSSQLAWWVDFSDSENYTDYESVVPQKLSDGDTNVYRLLESARDMTGNNNDLIINEDFSSDLGLKSSVSPVIAKDNFLKKTFARFDGSRNFMEIDNSDVLDFREMSSSGISIFMAGKLGKPTKSYGSPLSPEYSRFKEKRSIILGKGIGNTESTDFTLSIRNKGQLGGKTNYFSWEKDNTEVGSFSEIIDPSKITVYSFQTSSNIDPSIYDEKGFYKNSIEYGYEADDDYIDESTLGESPTESPIFLGGLPYKANETSGIYSGLNLSGDIYEIIIVSGEVGKFTRQTIEGYLAHKYGLESNLPDNHTFKDNPPKRSNGSVIIRS